MLTVEIAEAFLKRYAQTITHQINIVNAKGFIIASTKESCIGSFDETAYKILKTDDLMVLTDNNNRSFADRYGVDTAVLSRGEKVGVIALIGKPQEVRDMISLVRVAFEQMLEYEQSKNNGNYRGNLRTQFNHMLLYENSANTASELSVLSTQMGFATDVMRIPILVTCSMNVKQDFTPQLLKACKTSDQDIVIKLTLGQILIFKSFPHMTGEILFQEYRPAITRFLEPVIHLVNEYNRKNEEQAIVSNISIPAPHRLYCLVGSFQNVLTNYRHSFNQCLWLQDYLDHPHRNLLSADLSSGIPMDSSTFYFYDNLGTYIKCITPLTEFNRIFNAITQDLDDDQIRRIISTLSILHRHNYNMNTASQELGVHKNTLIFRYNKIKKQFHINPAQVVADREFVENLIYYLDSPR